MIYIGCVNKLDYKHSLYIVYMGECIQKILDTEFISALLLFLNAGDPCQLKKVPERPTSFCHGL